MGFFSKPIKSRYLKPDHRNVTGHEIWTVDGMKYRRLYSLLYKLRVVDTNKLVQSLEEIYFEK